MKVNYFLSLDISREWKDACRGKYSFSELAEIIADKLTRIRLPHKLTNRLICDDLRLFRLSLIDQFNDLAESRKATLIDFSTVMEKLHEWAEYIHGVTFKSVHKSCNVNF